MASLPTETLLLDFHEKESEDSSLVLTKLKGHRRSFWARNPVYIESYRPKHCVYQCILKVPHLTFEKQIFLGDIFKTSLF